MVARAAKKLYPLSNALKYGNHDGEVLAFVRAVLVHASVICRPYTLSNIIERHVETREDITL